MRNPETLAHRGDPDTSKKAASRAVRKQILFSAILQILANRPRTAEACEEAYFDLRADYGWPMVAPYSVKRRLSELHKAGRVQDSGRREHTLSGRPAIIWEISS